MNWNDITVQRFQDIAKLTQQKDLDEMDRLISIISLMYDKTETQVEDMSVVEFNAKASACKFLLTALGENLPGKPSNYIRIGGKWFYINLNPAELVKQMKQRQYVELLHYGQKPIDNMHKIMASIVQPIKWGFKCKNDAKEHDEVANLFLQAPVTTVYHTALFFCNLYRNLIKSLTPSLLKEMTTAGMNQNQATEMITAFKNITVGYTQQEKSQTLKS